MLLSKQEKSFKTVYFPGLAASEIISTSANVIIELDRNVKGDVRMGITRAGALCAWSAPFRPGRALASVGL